MVAGAESQTIPGVNLSELIYESYTLKKDKTRLTLNDFNTHYTFNNFTVIDYY